MQASARRTTIVFGRLQARELRLEAARNRQHGLQVLTVEQLACRLAGGFHQAINDEDLRKSIQATLPVAELGELDPIKLLPGMVNACVDTLRKVWTSQINLHNAEGHPRLHAVATLEEAVLQQIPAGMKRPGDLVQAALLRIEHAPSVLGPIELLGMTELEPCWRPLLAALATVTQVRWVAGPRSVPAWLEDTAVEVVTSERRTPTVQVASASTALHESIEALRWARQLIASGTALPHEIAIASVSPGEFDDHFLALRAEANFDLHFAHGTKLSASRDGQTAAALADMLLRGISQRKLRRLASLLSKTAGPLSELPAGWMSVLPMDAPLASAKSWKKLLATLSGPNWPDDVDHTPELQVLVALLLQGVDSAAAAGDALLRGRSLAIWRKALAAGPAASLELTLGSMREDDGLQACASVAWMPASYVAASPRRYVRLLGLNSSRWPRRLAEDRLLSDHIVPRAQLDPLPAAEADRRDFQTILATTEHEVVLSYSRRDSGGRLLGRSGLLQGMPEPVYLRRHRVAEHAYSEADRLASRSVEYRDQAKAATANQCWRNWLRPVLTVSDGVLREDHPLAMNILQRLQSASSLSLLLRNPAGFLWKYGLGLKAPQTNDEPLVLDALAFGNLVHEVLDVALHVLVGAQEREASLDTGTAVRTSIVQVSDSWEALQPVPPRLLWQRTLTEVENLCEFALRALQTNPAGWRSFSEIPFGGAKPKSHAALPWNATLPVEIPGTGFHINGYIDRLDVSGDGQMASVYDYKTGKLPKDGIVLNKGKELQRCLYGFAVRALLGNHVGISATLLYLREQQELRLDAPAETLALLQQFLTVARSNLASGGTVPGIAAGEDFDDLAFALPANAANSYCIRKMPAIRQRLGAATDVWEAQ
jgi:PD-(D/E)XK nuclease superfamily